jgi:small conductance mechanosensitive channel
MMGQMPVPKTPPKMFETRSHAWNEVGLLNQVSPRAAKRAAWEALLLAVLFVAVVVVYDNRTGLFGLEGQGRAHASSSPEVDTAVQIVTAILLLFLGWAIARNLGRALGPALFRRLDPATAGPVGFLIRLATLAITLLAALRVAGVDPRTLLVGGAFTAVILGLAAQQTLGNLFAGTVLLSARPFRVGDRVRLQGGPIAGQIEGTVSTQGLLYTTFVTGADSIMIPNSVVLNLAVLPLREPEAVDMRARLRAGMTPGDLQELLDATLSTRLREPPRITLEELDGDAVVVRIVATPARASEGRRLASELLAVVSEQAPRSHAEQASTSHAEQASRSHAEQASRPHAEQPPRPHAEQPPMPYAEPARTSEAERAPTPESVGVRISGAQDTRAAESETFTRDRAS